MAFAKWNHAAQTKVSNFSDLVVPIEAHIFEVKQKNAKDL